MIFKPFWYIQFANVKFSCKVSKLKQTCFKLFSDWVISRITARGEAKKMIREMNGQSLPFVDPLTQVIF